MKIEFIRATEDAFRVGDREIALRSVGIGSFLNLEFFMLGLYGTDGDIRRCLRNLHGPEKAARFWTVYCEHFLAEPDLAFIASLGVDAVRLAFGWRIFEPEAGDGGFDEKGFVQLDRVIRLCERHGLRAILDLHAAPGGQNADWHSDNPTGMALLWEFPELRRKTLALWERIAERYRDDPWVGGYDLLNEPVIDPDRVAELDRFHHELVAAVRRKDRNHLCFVEGNFYGGVFRPFTPIDDDNLAYSFHAYPFFGYLSRSDEELAALDMAEERRRGVSWLRDDEHLEHVRKVLRRPLWCGETGTFYCPELGNVRFYLDAFRGFLGLLEEHRIPWSVWTYKDIGQEGLLRIREDSDWMRMANRVRSEVSYIQESRLMLREDERLKQLPFPVRDHTKHVLKRRTIADQQLIMTEKMEQVLATIPFEELLRSTEAFRFERCHPQPELVAAVRRR